MNPLTRASFLTATLLLAATGATAEPYCYEDSRSNALTCYEESSVTEVNGIRYADMLTGGPKGVRRNGYQFAVNCSTGVMHLKDRQGVSFAGGHRDSTELSRKMVGWICSERMKTSKKK